MSDSIKPEILLIASQIPQQELALIAQLLQSQGFKQAPREKNASSVAFETADKTNRVTLKFYQEIGALRLELTGEVSKKIGAALGQYMEALTSERINELIGLAQSDMERRIYVILLVLTYADATDAMAAMRKPYFDEGSDAQREGLVQGLAFLETPDVGNALELIETMAKGQPIAAMARKAIDGLSERGIIRESVASFKAKVEAIIADNPKGALELIEKYLADAPAPALRALHARALRLLGRADEAASLLSLISISSPDAAEAFCERALLREAGGFALQAMTDAQSALACDPNNQTAAEIFQRLQLVLQHASSNAEDRLTQFSKAIENNPDDANLRCQRAECLLELKRPMEAIDDLKTAQKLAENDLRLPLLLTEAYLAVKYYGAALEQATRAQKRHVSAQEASAWLLRPRVFMAMNRPEKALSAIHEIPPELRDEDAVILCRGIVEETLGHTDEASAAYRLVPEGHRAIFEKLGLVLYKDLPIFRSIAGLTELSLREPPASPLGDEPTDPFFKRCDACGALTMKRRTFCKECSNATFI
ncbi:MAG: tetratricopeptide repeat protein [Proteobacteria bacterium]|nr:tetratricopeptide repeat protein [Pseudomonadota bacterium]